MDTLTDICYHCQRRQLHKNITSCSLICDSHRTTRQPFISSSVPVANHHIYSTLRALLLCVMVSLIHHTDALMYKVPLYKLDTKLNKAVEEHPSGDNPSIRSAMIKSDRDALHGQPGEGYYVQMAIGTPPQMLNVLVDTGSSNFAIASASDPDITMYFNISQSSSYWSSGSEVSVPYTQGDWVGILGQEVVFMKSMDNVSIEVSMAFITEAENFFINASEWQGILGLAYAEIARPDSSVEPFFDALVRQTDIQPIFSIQLCGVTGADSNAPARMDGTMTLGGIDESLYTGDMYYAPLYKEWYYEVVITDIAVQGTSLDMDCKEYNFDKTIVDSGTTNLRLPKRVFQQVVLLIEQNTHLIDQEVPPLFWSGDDLLCWAIGGAPWSAFPSIEITLATGPNSTVTLTLSPQQYLRGIPDQDVLDTSIITTPEDCYKFAVSPSETGTVLGAVVMEAFYVVFDQEAKRVGFAVNTCPNKHQDALHPFITGPFAHDDTMDCAYIKPESTEPALLIVAYIMAGICGICLLPLVLMFFYWQISRCRHEEADIATETTADDQGLLNSHATDR